MTDYRKILMLRSKGCSQREMERSKVASREKTKEVYEAADKLGLSWPLVPARVRKPQDKSAAEASVRSAQTWIIAALRNRKFFSIREMNEAVAKKLEELNSRPFQRMAGTRRSAYLEEEKQYMLPLPAVPFEAAVWFVSKVPNDYLISDGRNKYSVPYNLIGEKVDIRVTRTVVEVFYHDSRVASHRRSLTLQRKPLVKLEHMPLAHQKYLAYNAGDFGRWAMSMGPMTEKNEDDRHGGGTVQPAAGLLFQ